MKNNSLQFLLLSFFLASCGGGGGGSSLVLTVQQFNSFSVNEDDIYETVITSSKLALTFEVGSESSDGPAPLSLTFVGVETSPW